MRPEVTLGDYTGYPFGVEIEQVDDAKVERVIDELRDQHASLRAVEDRPVRTDDWVVIAFQGTRDGVPFEGGSAERFPMVVGGGRMIPGFEEALVGLSTGEEKDFDVTFPDDYPDAALAGQPAHFHVTVREIREKVLPDADDAFAQEIGASFADMAALRDGHPAAGSRPTPATMPGTRSRTGSSSTRWRTRRSRCPTCSSSRRWR